MAAVGGLEFRVAQSWLVISAQACDSSLHLSFYFSVFSEHIYQSEFWTIHYRLGMLPFISSIIGI